MAKPIIQIKIEGPEGSGKTMLAQSLATVIGNQAGYEVTSPASSYDSEDSFHLENDFHIIQIREKKTRKEVGRG